MRTFTDGKGREWTLDLNVSALRRVRDLCGVDLAEVVEKDKDLLFRLYARPETIGAVLWGIVQPQAAGKGIDRADFDDSLSGAALHAGKTALLDEITAFFTSFLPGEGALISRWRTLMDGMAETLIRQAGERMEALATPERRATALPAQPLPGSGSASGDAPGYADSTQAP
jgi:hypothetical protein